MSPFSSSYALTPDPIARELDIGENVLWSGAPDPARMWRKAIPVALFSIPLGAFIAFWMWGASASLRSALSAGKTPDLFSIGFPAFGLLFVGIIVLMALSPWYEAAKARRTFYALTDRRALIIVEGKQKSVRSVMPAEFMLERRDLGQSGDVILKREIKGSGDDKTTTEIGFFGIENPREVERIARELAQSSS
ncbi:hypothetical protein IAD21_03442 [Abditibacteriota bacterium]|nr:hypothetical protein IAD21_03442 [Abditibacteriota bacterium]